MPVFSNNDAQFISVESSEFEGFENGFPPEGWEAVPNWIDTNNGIYVNSGETGAFYWNTNGNGADDGKMITDLQNSSLQSVSLFAAAFGNPDTEISIQYSTDKVEWSIVGEPYSFSQTESFEKISVDFSGVTLPEQFYVAIAISCPEMEWIALDDISLNYGGEVKGVAAGLNGNISIMENDEWRSIHSGDQYYSGVYSEDGENIYAVGIGGTITYTNNGGESWEDMDFPSNGWLDDIIFNDESRIAVGTGGLISQYSNDQWESRASESCAGLRSVYFTDDEEVYATGYGGTIIHSVDGGFNWDRYQTEEQGWIWDMERDGDIFAFSGDDGLVYIKNQDQYEKFNTSVTSTLYGIDINSRSIVAVGKDGSITVGGRDGSSWVSIDQITFSDLKDIQFATDEKGFIVGTAGTVLKTVDGGSSWELQSIGVNSDLYAVQFISETEGWIGGRSGSLLHTTNGGDDWNIVETPVSTDIRTIKSVGEGKIWIAGADKRICYSDNYGEQWVEYNVDCNLGIWGIDFNSNGIGIAVANGGEIHRYTNQIADIAVSVDEIYIDTNRKSEFSKREVKRENPNASDISSIDIVESPSSNIDRTDIDSKDRLVLQHDDGTIEGQLGLKWNSELPANEDQTIGFAVMYEAENSWLDGVQIYFRAMNQPGYRLFIWEDEDGVPASGVEPIYKNMDMKIELVDEWSYIDLSSEDIVVPERFWIGVCYNRLAPNTPDFSIGYDESTRVDDEMFNVDGYSQDWLLLGEHNYALGIRAVITDEEVYSSRFTISNEGEGELSLFDITKNQEWISSIYPKNFNLAFGESKEITIIVDPNSINKDLYEGSITIHSNDPDESELTIPVKMDGVVDMGENLVTQTTLFNNYPNPFNPTTTISFSLTNMSSVKLTIFNSKGEMVSEILNKDMGRGLHSVNFNGESLNSGLYFYSLDVNGVRDTKKMILVK
jgi:photosystem II stability/assembly factor-like uncharacterized protein